MQSKTLEIELGPSEFSLAITRIAVTQICQSVGFKAAQRSTLETLTDVAARYLQALAKSAAASANSTGRTDSHLLDIIHALDDLHSMQGFPGASNVNQTLYASSNLVEIMKFVKYTDEIPFAKPILRQTNISSKQSILPRSLGCANDGWKHIPRWLPAIPIIGEWDSVGNERLVNEKLGFESCEDGEGRLSGKKRAVVEERVGKNVELAPKRGRVRFKMSGVAGEGFGVDLRSGVCRGRKRVSCQLWSGY